MTLRLRAARWSATALRLSAAALGRRTVLVEDRVDEYRGYWQAAARELGAEFVPLDRAIWEVHRGPTRVRIANDLVPFDDPVTLELAGNKAFCDGLARAAGVPVPDSVVCNLSNLPLAHRLLGRALVVKPAEGTSSGKGVTVGVETRAQLERAAALASFFSGRIVVAEMVAAETCRLLYLDGECVHGVRRRGLRVTGDGDTSIQGLLERRGRGSEAADRITHLTLAAQGLSVESVPEDGRTVVARCLPAGERKTRELRTVYDEDITGRVHSSIVEDMASLVRAVGSRFAGVDFLTNDPGVPLRESKGVFLEVNTTPGIHHHYVGPADGRRTVAVRVLERLLSQSGSPS